MHSNGGFYLGVIEGFYGRSWPDSSRLKMMPWLAALGFRRFMYAPKAEASLRKAWKQPFSDESSSRISNLAAQCRAVDVACLTGLSPYALYENYDRTAKQSLRDKIDRILDLGVDGIGLLFDDMPGHIDDLAARQTEIAGDVEHWIKDGLFVVCPTYYSDDPVLDRVFGDRPAQYLNTFCRELSRSTEVFWTGPQVCSTEISVEHLRRATSDAGRQLALWDNYPVNDSKARSDHLYLGPIAGREAGACDYLTGHWSNAMNQAALSLPALASFPALYADLQHDVDTVFAEAGITEELIEACAIATKTPRSELRVGQQTALSELAGEGSLAAHELRDWLDGVYEFDPACLTD